MEANGGICNICVRTGSNFVVESVWMGERNGRVEGMRSGNAGVCVG